MAMTARGLGSVARQCSVFNGVHRVFWSCPAPPSALQLIECSLKSVPTTTSESIAFGKFDRFAERLDLEQEAMPECLVRGILRKRLWGRCPPAFEPILASYPVPYAVPASRWKGALI